MELIPLHKNLVIEKINEDKDFFKNQSQYEKAKVIKVSKEISNIKEGDIILIPNYSGNVYIENSNYYFIISLEEIIAKFSK